MKNLLDEAVALALLSELQSAITAVETAPANQYTELIIDLDSKIGQEIAMPIVLKHFQRIREDYERPIPPYTPDAWMSVRSSFYNELLSSHDELLAACKLALSGTTNPLIEPKLREVIARWDSSYD